MYSSIWPFEAKVHAMREKDFTGDGWGDVVDEELHDEEGQFLSLWRSEVDDDGSLGHADNDEEVLIIDGGSKVREGRSWDKQQKWSEADGETVGGDLVAKLRELSLASLLPGPHSRASSARPATRKLECSHGGTIAAGRRVEMVDFAPALMLNGRRGTVDKVHHHHNNLQTFRIVYGLMSTILAHPECSGERQWNRLCAL